LWLRGGHSNGHCDQGTGHLSSQCSFLCWFLMLRRTVKLSLEDSILSRAVFAGDIVAASTVGLMSTTPAAARAHYWHEESTEKGSFGTAVHSVAIPCGAATCFAESNHSWLAICDQTRNCVFLPLPPFPLLRLFVIQAHNCVVRVQQYMHHVTPCVLNYCALFVCYACWQM
jgi:hypothetical protein